MTPQGSLPPEAHLILGIAVLIYFLPFSVAIIRNHNDWLAITVLDLLLGWTVVGWLVALIWACTGNTRNRRP